MALCPYGASVAPGAPELFTFEESFILELLEHVPLPEVALGAFLTQIWLQLPSGAQNTADFVAQEPEGELPQVTDWLLLGFPPAAQLAGAYERIGRWIRLNKWVELAVCNPPPPTDPSLSEQLCSITLERPASGALIGTCGPFSGFDWFSFDPLTYNPNTFRWEPAAPTPRDEIDLDVTSADPTPYAASYNDMIQAHIGISSSYYFGPLGNTGDPGHPPAPQTWVSVWWAEKGVDPPPLTVIHVVGHRTPVPTEPVLPPAGPAPEPPPVTDCEGCGRAVDSLRERLDQIVAILQYQNATASPAEAWPDETPTPITPAPGRMTKPPTAVGVVVEVTAIAPDIAHYGNDPMFWADLGHVAMLTPQGAMPSQLLKHNPLVLFPIPFVVTELAFDLHSGVEAQLRWLNAYK